MSIAGMNFTRSAAAAAPAQQRLPMAGHRAQRFAAFAPNSYHADSRTVDAVLSAGSAVQRSFGSEELEISSAAVDLSRAAAGLVPLLDAHNQFQADGVIGAVSNVRIVDGRLVGTLRFGQTPRAQAVEGMVARGELRGVSIGYAVQTWEAQQVQDTWRATRWQLLEVSLVPVPADALTGFRSEAPFQIENEEEDMLTRNEPGSPSAAAPAASPVGANQTRFSASQAVDFIRMGREFRVETAADELVRRNEAGEIGTEAARDSLLRAAAERQRSEVSGISGAGTGHNDRTFDNPAFQARAIEDAIYSRLSGKAPSDEARQLRGLSMVALASDMLSRAGIRDVHRMSPDAVLNAAAWNNNGGRSVPAEFRVRGGGYNTTSDFPDLLTAAGNRHLLDRFEEAAPATKTVSRERSAADFREISGLQLSAFGILPELGENSEIKHGTFQSRKETYQLKTFAKMFGLSRQAIINDDLGAFSQAATIMGRAAAETEAQLFADLINSNPAMSDSVALFHANHHNLAAMAALPSINALDDGRFAMRSQLDFDGITPLAAAPAYVLASPKHETVIEQLLTATINPTQVDDTNPFQGKMKPLIDPRLDADPWFLFADPGLVPVLEHAYLNGNSGPTVEMQPGWNTLGQEFRVHMDFGAGVVDYRGAFKNPGA